MAIKLFTHTDLDGVGSSILANLMNEEVSVQYCENHMVDEIIGEFIDSKQYDKFTCAIIADLSVNSITAEKINSVNDLNESAIFHLYDHHRTAEWLNEYEWADVIVEDSGKLQCGTSLFYQHVYSKHVNSNVSKDILDAFVESVRSWDTWDWADNSDLYAEDLSILFSERGISDFVTSMCNNIRGEQLFTSADMNIIVLSKSKESAYLSNMKNKWFEVKYDGMKFAAIFASQYISKLGNLISRENPQLAGVILLTEYGLSFRTVRDDIDVGYIAKQLGGGGHVKAAGVTFTDALKSQLVDKALISLRVSNFKKI